jgi:hypothetical protein
MIGFDPDKHPRGYAGRFASHGGLSPNAHAMRKARPRPAGPKIQHAAVPHLRGGSSRSIGISGPRVPMPGD